MKTLRNRLLLRQKFLLRAVIGLVLVAAPLILFIKKSNRAVVVAKREADGITPLQAILKMVSLMQQHRGLAALVLADQAGGTMEQIVESIKRVTVNPARLVGIFKLGDTYAAADISITDDGPSRAALLPTPDSHLRLARLIQA